MTLITATRGGVGRILMDAGAAVEIPEIASALAVAVADPAVRVILIGLHGTPVFGGFGHERDAGLLDLVERCGKPVLVRAEGAICGLLVGLAAAADLVVAADDAEFSVPDVRSGSVASAVAGPLVRALGPREARRWLVTGDRFRAPDARASGLVHEVAPRGGLDALVDRSLLSLLKADREAVAALKAELRGIQAEPARTRARA